MEFTVSLVDSPSNSVIYIKSTVSRTHLLFRVVGILLWGEDGDEVIWHQSSEKNVWTLEERCNVSAVRRKCVMKCLSSALHQTLLAFGWLNQEVGYGSVVIFVNNDRRCEVLNVRNSVTVWLVPHGTRLAHTIMDQNGVCIFWDDRKLAYKQQRWVSWKQWLHFDRLDCAFFSHCPDIALITSFPDIHTALSSEWGTKFNTHIMQFYR
jgi:hypothetical protein